MTSRDSLKNRTFSAGGSGNYNQIYGIFNYVFKLSAILAPDYVDANGNLIPKDGGTDKGNWIKLEYTEPEEFIFSVASQRQITEINYLEKITTPTHRAEFVLENDKNPYIYNGLVAENQDNEYMSSLDEIKLYTQEGTSVLKKIQFTQSDSFGTVYCEYDGQGNINNYRYCYNYSGFRPNRQRLDTLRIFDNTGSKDYHYSFEYMTEPDYSGSYTPVPIDNWGYLTRSYPNDTTLTCWLLKKVTLPTGGTIEFGFESDRYQTYFSSPRGGSGQTTCKKGGVRLIQKVFTDPITQLVEKYRYEYANENKFETGYGFISSEPSQRNPDYPRIPSITIAHNLHTDVHYPDVTIINPDGSKIQKFYSCACTAVKMQTATGSSRDYIWLDQCTKTDTTDFTLWPAGLYGTGVQLWPFWYSYGSVPDTNNCSNTYAQYSSVIPFRSPFGGFDENYCDFHPYTYADKAYRGELLDFDDCNTSAPAGSVEFNITTLDNSWKRGHILKESYYDDTDTKIKEIKRFYTMIPLAEDVYDALAEVYISGQYSDIWKRAFCLCGWARLDTLKEIYYDSGGSNPVTKLTHFVYNDTNGLATQTREVGNVGNIKVTLVDYAFSHYNSVSDTMDMLDKNILAAKARETIYKYDMLYSVPTNPDNLLANRARKSIITTWKENWNGYDGQWAPERTFQWYCDDSSLTLPSFTAWETTQTPSSDQWALTLKILECDENSRPASIMNGKNDTTNFYYGTNSDPYADESSGHFLTATQRVIGNAENPPIELGYRPGDDLFVEYQYNDMAQLTKITDENLNIKIFEYDSFWRLYREKKQSDIIRTIQYHLNIDGTESVFDSDDPNGILFSDYFNATDIGQSLTFYDGFGRAIQTQMDEGNSMIIQQSIYDSLGRLSVETLPARDTTLSSFDYKVDFVDSSWGSGNAMTSSSFISDYYDSVPIESNAPDAGGYPYTYTRFYANPLDRPFQIGHPGSAFRVGGGREIEYDYEASNYVNVGSVNYPQHSLLKTTTNDENSHELIEYHDVFGNIVKTIADPGASPHLNLETGFQYDILGNNIVIIPPNAANSDNSNYCTNMRYNTMQWLIEKTSPDAGTITYKYDNNGNLRFMQDSLRRANGRDIIFHIYDELNRLLISGKATNDSAIPLWSNLNGNLDYRNDGTYNFESDSTEGTDYLLVNKYGAEPAYGSSVWADAEDPGCMENLKSRLAATAYYDENTDKWGYSFYSYDNKGNIDKIIQDLPGEGLGVKRMHYTYDRQKNITRLNYQSGNDDAFYMWYEYDSVGRLKNIFSNNTNSKPSNPLADYDYWPGGQIKRKQLNDPYTGNKVQGMDYLFHIRGWLSQINDQNIGVAGDDPGGDDNDRFGQVLGYESQNHIGTAFTSDNQYNGNISWAIQSTYGYSDYMTGSVYAYDQINRLTEADAGYYNPGGGTWQQFTSNGFDSRNIQYDDNGNPGDLSRYNKDGELLRNQYIYYNNTNQLKNIHNSGNQDYKYDGNGNLIFDNNRHITDILYDYRNLPRQFSIESSNKLKCGYDAEGNRIYKKILFE